MPVSISSVVVATSDQVSAGLKEEAVVLGLKRGTYYGLDEVGARIWDLVHEPMKVSDVRDTIVAEYEVDEETCLRELLDFLTKLEAEKLIEVS